MTKGLDTKKQAIENHKNVPPDWYYRSVKRNLIQRFVHTRRFKEVAKLIEPVKGKILDVGSADGVFTKVILDKSGSSEIIGIDVLKKSVDWANNHWSKQKQMKFKVGDAHTLEYKSETFDAIFALEVLEHVYDPVKILKDFRRMLKKGGYAVFLVPAETLLFKIVWYFWKNYYVGKIWQDAHLHEYSHNYLTKMCKDVGFEIVTDKKIIFNCLHLVKVRK